MLGAVWCKVGATGVEEQFEPARSFPAHLTRRGGGTHAEVKAVHPPGVVGGRSKHIGDVCNNSIVVVAEVGEPEAVVA